VEEIEAIAAPTIIEHHAKGADDHAPATLLRAPLLYGNGTDNLLPNDMLIHRSLPVLGFSKSQMCLTRSVGLVAPIIHGDGITAVRGQ
jgi:hypothetical protein